jgi:hypothetical protein
MNSAAGRRRRERRWIVLGEDGRHVTLGRHSDPTAAEIAGAEEALTAQGLHGWLAVIEGAYWAKRGRVILLMVRPLGTPQSPFAEAAAAFETLRLRALQLS